MGEALESSLTGRRCVEHGVPAAPAGRQAPAPLGSGCEVQLVRLPRVAGGEEGGGQHEPKGQLQDNPVAESFFATVEIELIQDEDWHTRNEARRRGEFTQRALTSSRCGIS